MPKLSTEQRRAEAQELKKSRLLPMAFKQARMEITEQWETAATSDEREALHAELKALGRARERLESLIRG